MIKIVENNTLGRRKLPPTKSHPQGKWLEPGRNEVPDLYLQELDATKVVFKDLEGKEYDYFPGREALNAMLAPTKIADVAGILRLGPQITIYTRDQVMGEDKAAWPHDLNSLTEKQALAFVEACTDVEVIKRWHSNTKAEKVTKALRGKVG